MGMSCLNSLAARTVHAMHTVRPRCSDPLARVHADVQDLMRRSLLQHKALLEQNQAMLDQDMALLEAAMQEVLLEAAMQQVLLDPRQAEAMALVHCILNGLIMARAHQDAQVAHLRHYVKLAAEFSGHEVADAVRNTSG